ncbi:MAG: glycosyltransferase [Halobacteriota archaeon]|jgi:glycosyltransferase involved in cell wall biosynthesis
MCPGEPKAQTNKAVSRLRICFVSPYPPRFDGIATYSHELVEGIKKRGHTVYVICNPDFDAGGHAGQKNVFAAMDPQKVGWYQDVFDAIEKLNPDVVHIQHEYGLYDIDGKLSTDLLDLLVRLNLQRIPTVVTYHSVYSTLGYKECLFMNLSLQLVDAGIVHEELQKIFLPVNLDWVPQNVTVIPHGAEVLKAGGVPGVVESKKAYGLQGKDVAMCLGWWEQYKRFEDVVEIWPQVVSEVPDAVLVIAGDARPGSRDGVRYKPTLLKAVADSPAKDNIVVIQGSFQPKEYLTIENAADIVVLPYEQSSQSGVLAHAFSLGKPAVVTDVGGLRDEVEASGGGVVVPRGDLEQLKDYVVLLLSNRQIRERYSQRALAYVEKRIGWKYVAGIHQSLYLSIIKKKSRAIRA